MYHNMENVQTNVQPHVHNMNVQEYAEYTASLAPTDITTTPTPSLNHHNHGYTDSNWWIMQFVDSMKSETNQVIKEKDAEIFKLKMEIQQLKYTLRQELISKNERIKTFLEKVHNARLLRQSENARITDTQRELMDQMKQSHVLALEQAEERRKEDVETLQEKVDWQQVGMEILKEKLKKAQQREERQESVIFTSVIEEENSMAETEEFITQRNETINSLKDSLQNTIAQLNKEPLFAKAMDDRSDNHPDIQGNIRQDIQSDNSSSVQPEIAPDVQPITGRRNLSLSRALELLKGANGSVPKKESVDEVGKKEQETTCKLYVNVDEPVVMGETQKTAGLTVMCESSSTGESDIGEDSIFNFSQA